MDRDRAALTRSTAAAPRLPFVVGIVPLAFVTLFYLWPLATILARVLDVGDVADTVGRSGFAEIAWFTLWQSVVSTIATLVPGLAAAYLLARWEFRGRRLLRAVVTVPFLLPTVVVGAAFVALLPDHLVGSPTAVIAAHVYFNIAVVVRVVGARWAQLPADLTGAARTLGASAWAAWRSVTAPLIASSIVAAASVVFLFTFTSFGVVQILGGPTNPTLEVEVARRALEIGDASGAAIISVLQMAVLATVIVAAAIVQRRTDVVGALSGARPRRPRSTRQRVGVASGAILLAGVTMAPLVAVALSSLRVGHQWSLRAWRDLGATDIRPGLQLGVDAAASIWRSVRTAIAATIVSVAVGALATLAIARARRGGRVLDAALMLPLATSSVTLGLGMLITFDQEPFDWRAQPWLVPVGHALVAIPFVVRTALPILRARPDSWLGAAATLGASPLRAWWEIDVALLRRPLVVAAGFAAAISLGEFGATTLLGRTGRETIPVAIARLLARAGDLPRAQAFALATLLAAVTTVLIVAVDAVDRSAIDPATTRGAPRG